MTTAAEAASAKSQLAAGLAAGLNTLSAGQQITFKQYTRFVNPLDGFVYWVVANPLNVVKAAKTSSLHYSTNRQQNEDETPSVNQVILTSPQPINDLNAVAPNTLYIGNYAGLTFAFSSRGRYYQQADLHHYVGTAVLPALQSQIVDDVTSFDETTLIVSNSLPIWLGMNSYVPPYPGFVCPFTLYSSYAVPENLVPPYGVVHVAPESTKAMLGSAFLDRTLGHWQLARDTVRVTIYGARNDDIMTFLDFVNQYSYDWNYVGMLNSPIVRDEKRTQAELAVLAMKKTIEFEVSYNQQSARNIARQLIEQALITYLPQPLVAGDVAYLTPTNV